MYHLSGPRVLEGKDCSMEVKRVEVSSRVGVVRAMLEDCDAVRVRCLGEDVQDCYKAETVLLRWRAFELWSIISPRLRRSRQAATGAFTLRCASQSCYCDTCFYT